MLLSGAVSERETAKLIVVIANQIPAVSETFVYREVEFLRAAGWRVVALGLHPAQNPPQLLVGLPHADQTLYGAGVATLLVHAVGEALVHPVRALRTLACAASDALRPGETLGPGGRFLLIFQAVAALAAARRLRPLGAAHFHCHFAHAPTTVGMYAARQLGVSFSFVGHANDLFRNRSLLRRKLARAAFVSCISEWHRSWYESLVPSAAPRLAVVRCGVDVHSWTVGAAAPKSTSPDGALRVLCVARLIPKKGVDLLIRALSLASERHHLEWQLSVAGDGPERANLDALARECGCGGRVRFLGGVRNEEVPGLMRGSDLFALPCRVTSDGDRDGIPVVLMEAMAAGLPVVSGDLPAIRELVVPDQTGLVFPANDIEGLARRIAELARSPARCRELAAAGRNHVVREFSLEVNGRRLERALQRVLGSPEVELQQRGCG